MSSSVTARLGLRTRTRAVAICLFLGIFGWFSGMTAVFLMESYLLAFGYGTATLSDIGVSVAFNVVGAGGLALAYLIVRYDGFDRAKIADFLRVRYPTRWDFAWVVAGLLGAFVVIVGYQIAIEAVDPFGTTEGTTHSGVEAGREYPILLLLGIPLAILLTGPGEELLYRGVIQSRLGETFSTAPTVVVASLVFGAVHLPAYMGDDIGAVLVSLGTVTTLGLYFGILYELSETLVVPALVHGCYNAVVYLMNFLTYA